MSTWRGPSAHFSIWTILKRFSASIRWNSVPPKCAPRPHEMVIRVFYTTYTQVRRKSHDKQVVILSRPNGNFWEIMWTNSILWKTAVKLRITRTLSNNGVLWHSLCIQHKNNKIDLHFVLCFSNQISIFHFFPSRRKKHEEGTLL